MSNDKINNSKDCYGDHPVLDKVHELYHELLEHDGFGELRMEIRILKRGQKEVIIHCGKQYRFVVDSPKITGREIRIEEGYCNFDNKTNRKEVKS